MEEQIPVLRSSASLDDCISATATILGLNLEHIRFNKVASHDLLQRLPSLMGALEDMRSRGPASFRKDLKNSLADLHSTLMHAQRALLKCQSGSALRQILLGASLQQELITASAGIAAAVLVAGLGGSSEENVQGQAGEPRGSSGDPLVSAGAAWAFHRGLLTPSQLVEAVCEDKLATQADLLALRADVEEEMRWQTARQQAGCSLTQAARRAEELAELLQQIGRSLDRMQPPSRGRMIPAGPEGEPMVPICGHFLCPISLELMWDPWMVIESGQTYEKTNIQKWFQQQESEQRWLTDPVTRKRMTDPSQMAPNSALKGAIREHLRTLAPFCSLPEGQWPLAKVRLVVDNRPAPHARQQVLQPAQKKRQWEGQAANDARIRGTGGHAGSGAAGGDGESAEPPIHGGEAEMEEPVVGPPGDPQAAGEEAAPLAQGLGEGTRGPSEVETGSPRGLSLAAVPRAPRSGEGTQEEPAGVEVGQVIGVTEDEARAAARSLRRRLTVGEEADTAGPAAGAGAAVAVAVLGAGVTGADDGSDGAAVDAGGGGGGGGSGGGGGGGEGGGVSASAGGTQEVGGVVTGVVRVDTAPMEVEDVGPAGSGLAMVRAVAAEAEVVVAPAGSDVALGYRAAAPATEVAGVAPAGSGAVVVRQGQAVQLPDGQGPQLSFKCIATVGPSNAIAFGPDGLLFSASGQSVAVWRSTSHIQNILLGDVVAVMAAGPDGSLFVVESGSTTIRQWKAGSWVASLQGCHTDYVRSLAVADDGTLFSGSADWTIRQWREGACVRTMEGHEAEVTHLACGPGETLFSAAFSAGSFKPTMIRQWGRDGSCLAAFTMAVACPGTLQTMTVIQDGTLVTAHVGVDNAMHVQKWKKIEPNGSQGRRQFFVANHEKLAVRAQRVDTVAVSKDGETCLTASSASYPAVRVWRGGVCVQVLEGHKKMIVSLFVGPDNNLHSVALVSERKIWRYE